MPRLVIAKEFLADYAKLQLPVRKAVDAAFDKFAAHTHAGLHLEKVTGARDPQVRTIRIDQSYRGVVLAPARGEEQAEPVDRQDVDQLYVSYAGTRSRLLPEREEVRPSAAV